MDVYAQQKPGSSLTQERPYNQVVTSVDSSEMRKSFPPKINITLATAQLVNLQWIWHDSTLCVRLVLTNSPKYFVTSFPICENDTTICDATHAWQWVAPIKTSDFQTCSIVVLVFPCQVIWANWCQWYMQMNQPTGTYKPRGIRHMESQHYPSCSSAFT